MVVYSVFFNGKLTLKEALALSAPGVSLGTISGAPKLLTIPAQIITLFQTFAASANGDNPYGVQKDALRYIERAVLMIKTIHER